MKSYVYKEKDPGNHPVTWWIVDAKDQILGRVASQVATLLKGKHKPTYTPHADMGDFVVVTNLKHIQLTGNKAEQKVYHVHSGYIGNMRHWSYEELMKRDATRVFEIAVKGMLGKNPLGRDQFRKLKCYANEEHPHVAQNPKPFTLISKTIKQRAAPNA